MRRRSLIAALSLAVVTAAVLAGCAGPAGGQPTAAVAASELHLGYFANVTHAPALVGLDKGLFAKELGRTKISTQVFNAGPATIEALSAGAIDAAFIGPSPAINSYIKSKGASVVVVAGAATGGAALVVRSGITSAAELKGTTLATPQLGNTQDVALRSWLATQGYKTSITGGGDVTISPSENADTLKLFEAGTIDGAWLPEPWVSRLVLEAHAHVLVDEASLWPNGAFPTTVLVVNKSFLYAHPQTVKALVAGEVDSVNWLNAHPTEAAAAINEQLVAVAGKGLSAPVIERALANVKFSVDPQAQAFPTLITHAVSAGTGTQGSITGLFDLSLLNSILTASGGTAVSAHGLGKE
ncbi:ABC transporter substrate-binding protein [Galbitalea soli]|nr:ABC transporter substrate-binding protein [Galbitalea soli]NYJ32018.1 NitT/TauT family transport system substrate-binding protein [Galbitalea soli]